MIESQTPPPIIPQIKGIIMMDIAKIAIFNPYS